VEDAPDEVDPFWIITPDSDIDAPLCTANARST